VNLWTAAHSPIQPNGGDSKYLTEYNAGANVPSRFQWIRKIHDVCAEIRLGRNASENRSMLAKKTCSIDAGRYPIHV
jgi:hypothetical protein